MFYEMSSDHEFHQFIASRTSLPIPLSFSLHDQNPSFSAAFDLCRSSSLNIQQLHHHESHVDDAKNSLISNSLALEGQRSVVPWSNEELLALFKFRSSMEVSLPEFTWGQVSRKLEEFGFKRSAEECKEKFEEGKNFNSVRSYNKNSRIFSELDEYYPDDHQEETQVSAENMETKNRADHQESEHRNKEAKTCEDQSEEKRIKKGKSSKKRKRKDELETLRDYFEAIVDKVIAQQEDLHNKLIESIVKRDEEKIAREEAWKIQEMNRSRTEIEIRVKDQAKAEERHATIIEFLNKFTYEDHYIQNNIEKLDNQNIPGRGKIDRSISLPSLIQVHSNSSCPKTNVNASSTSADTTALCDAGGKRWPRDEVLSLINLRCNLSKNFNGDSSKEGQKGPLWERISQGMQELGYKRSAKRCKEKWENINKYFRKTKDGNKKRSVDSRTCPYFHQLSCLCNGTATLVASAEENPHVN